MSSPIVRQAVERSRRRTSSLAVREPELEEGRCPQCAEPLTAMWCSWRGLVRKFVGCQNCGYEQGGD